MKALTETVAFAMSPIRVTFATMAICFSPTIRATCALLRGFTDTRMPISLLAALLVCLFIAPVTGFLLLPLLIGSANCLSCQGDGVMSVCSSCESNFFVDEMGGCSNCLFCAF